MTNPFGDRTGDRRRHRPRPRPGRRPGAGVGRRRHRRAHQDRGQGQGAGPPLRRDRGQPGQHRAGAARARRDPGRARSARHPSRQRRAEKATTTTAKSYLHGLRAIDPEPVKQAVGGARFQPCFFDNAQDADIRRFVAGVLGKPDAAAARSGSERRQDAAAIAPSVGDTQRNPSPQALDHGTDAPRGCAPARGDAVRPVQTSPPSAQPAPLPLWNTRSCACTSPAGRGVWSASAA